VSLKHEPAREASAARFAFFVLSPADQAVLARHGFQPIASPGS
jgi:ABC-type molybdate transport system substrate-binding protein